MGFSGKFIPDFGWSLASDFVIVSPLLSAGYCVYLLPQFTTNNRTNEPGFGVKRIAWQLNLHEKRTLKSESTPN